MVVKLFQAKPLRGESTRLFEYETLQPRKTFEADAGVNDSKERRIPVTNTGYRLANEVDSLGMKNADKEL